MSNDSPKPITTHPTIKPMSMFLKNHRFLLNQETQSNNPSFQQLIKKVIGKRDKRDEAICSLFCSPSQNLCNT
jgi:hypothetical protein